MIDEGFKMVGFIIVSHSEKVAEGVVEIAEQMNSKKVKIEAVGGVGDGRIGTNPLRIKEAIEKIFDGDVIFIFGDLGSSILGSQTAIDLLDDKIKEKVILVDAPLVEGAIAAIVQSSVTDNVNEIINAAKEAKTMDKF